MLRNIKFVVAILALVAILTPVGTAAAKPPNIIIILTDDQTEQLITGRDINGQPFLPFIDSQLFKARRFTNTYFAHSLCCPSRTTLLTGMYPHNHGVLNNVPPNGGWPKYRDLQLDRLSWPFYLQAAGYYTAMFGKFLNAYDGQSIPRGWNYWFAEFSSVAGSSFHWAGTKNGAKLVFSPDGTDKPYSTNVFTFDLLTALKRPEFATQPFAFMLATPSPHLPADPAFKYRGLYANEPLLPARKPSWNELDVSDKPLYVRLRSRLDASRTARRLNDWRRSIETGRSIDDAFRLVLTQLALTGHLNDTYIIFATDNGYLWGEHRLGGKVLPYQESVHSVTYVWGPGVVPGVDDRLVSNVDYFATIMDIARLPTPAWVDGRSLMPLLKGNTKIPWRQQFYIQGVPPEDAEGDLVGYSFQSVVTKDWTYVRYKSGEREFYDLNKDPFQLKNIATTQTAKFIQKLDSRTISFAHCLGETCRTTEELAPPAP